MREKTYYEILGVGNYATKAEIELAYQNKLFKTESVNKAYALLTHDIGRKNYDKKLLKEEEQKSYYEVLGVPTTATSKEITLAYDKVKAKKDISEEELKSAKKAYNTLQNPKKRSKYNINLGFAKLEKEAKLKLTTDISNIINSKPDFYVEYDNEKRQYMVKRVKEKIKTLTDERKEIRSSEDELTKAQEARLAKIESDLKIMRKEQSELKKGLVINYRRQMHIRKYENKIELINKQIDMLKSEKNIDGNYYRMKLSHLVDQLEMAQYLLKSWQLGRGQTEKEKVMENGKEVEEETKGVGLEQTPISKILYSSIERMNNIDSQLKKKDISNMAKIKLNIKRGFWKYIKAFSSGTIKLETAIELKIKDMAYFAPDYIGALNATEKELEERLEEARRVK